MSTARVQQSMPGSAGAAAPASAPWWSYGHVWLVIAGPALVILASVVTAVVVVRNPDPVVDADYYRKGIEINRTLDGGKDVTETHASPSMAPALVMRNHAATGVLPAAKPVPPR